MTNSLDFFFKLCKVAQFLMLSGARFHNLMASLTHVLEISVVDPNSLGVLYNNKNGIPISIPIPIPKGIRKIQNSQILKGSAATLKTPEYKLHDLYSGIYTPAVAVRCRSIHFSTFALTLA